MRKSTKTLRGGIYPIAESDHLQHLGSGVPADRVAARWTGEFRKPLAGEWYLSGTVVEAYRAPANLDTEYHIAELVEVETRMVVEVVRVLE